MDEAVVVDGRRVTATADNMVASKLGAVRRVAGADEAVLELLEDEEEGAAARATKLEAGKVEARAADPLAALGAAGAWRRRLLACCELTAAAVLECRGDGILYVDAGVVVIAWERCKAISLLTLGS